MKPVSMTLPANLVALALACLALPLSGAAVAQAAPAASTSSLPTWEQLPQAQRDELTAPLRDRWNANPDERARMLERARRWHAMPPGERERAHRGQQRWETMDPAKRAGMRALFERTRAMPQPQRRETFVLYHAMRDMPAEEREALKQRWRAMTPEERAAWVREHAPPRWRER